MNMMNTIVTSIVVVISSLAFSQGPAKELDLSKRVVIKDSLGNAIKLSDCTDLLNSKEYMLHPENNESGKVMYYLLKRASSEEQELFSNKMVSTVSSERFNEIKKGRFIFTSHNGEEIKIRRRKNKQVERIKNEDGSVTKTKYRITWLDDASYILKPWKKVTEMAKTPRYKIVEITGSSYSIRVIQKYSVGPSLQVLSL
ncbi:MAG: hypothetical protein Crog4KO_14630 [Crocinitomicaceae bacterium]